ncbi:MAG: hypothetical protein JO247_00890 [Chloroflexi bacterium]|nr:hypothetical protein [Chloroflexota bacterium]
MRTLTPTLQAAITSPGHQPAAPQLLLADVNEHWALARLDAPAKLSDGFAAVTADDGSLVRASLWDNGAAGNADLAVQRISNPATGAQWTTWTTLVAAACAANQPIALSLNPANVLRLFYADGPSAGTILKVFESTDHGQTWTGPAIVYTGASSFFYLASAGNDDLFACRNTAVGVWDVQFFKKSAGVWQAPVTWTLGTESSMYGVGAAWLNSHYYLLLARFAQGGIGIEAYAYDGAATWADLNFVCPVDSSNTGAQFRLPTLLIDAGFLRASYVLHNDGAVDGLVYERPGYTRSTATNGYDPVHGDGVHWSNQAPGSPQTLSMASAMPLVKAFGSYYITSATYTFASKLYTPGDPSLNADLSGRVLSYDRKERYLKDAELTIRVANADNSLTAGVPGLGRGTQLTLSEGWVTTLGSELVTVAQYIVQSWRFDRAPGQNELVISAADAGFLLDDENPIQLSYTSMSVLFILLDVLARCRIFDVFWPATLGPGIIITSFTIPAGHTYRQALHRLFGPLGLEYVIRADGSFVLHDPTEATPNSWTFHNEMLSWQHSVNHGPANHVRVFGVPGAGGESWDYASAEAVGAERYHHIVDRLINSNANASWVAVVNLLHEQRLTGSATVTTPANPGPEILDVLTINDSWAGVSQGYRASAIDTTFDVLKGEFEQTYELMGV